MSSNSENSFNNIYTSYYHRSYQFVKSYVHDEMAAEDIVADSLIKLWERSRLQEIDPIGPFLFSILKNRALDYLKHHAKAKNIHGIMEKVLNRELDIRTASLESSDPNEIFSNEIQEIIETTLKTLPERTREIFIMSRFGNKSHKEIADFYNISVKGIDYHISLSIKALRVSLRDYLPLLAFLHFHN